MTQDVFVWISQKNGEVDPISWEVLSAACPVARALGGKVVAIVLGENLDDALASQAIHQGADRAYVADDPTLGAFRVEPYAAVLTDLAKAEEPAALFLGASQAGLELAAYVSAKLGVGLASDCIAVDVDEVGLVATRPTLAGNLVTRVRFGEKRPNVLTLRRRAFSVQEPDSGRMGETRKVDAVLSKPEIPTQIDAYEEASGEVSLTDTRIVVSGGRGVGGPEGFTPIRALADALEGAMGASRAAVDAGWVSYAHQVGQTGKTVQPDLYIACGISGAIQHLAGMKTSKVIVAINQDPNASIFKHARYGIVGDLFAYVPALTAEFSKRLGT
jgi:electron transfer flavoprotein alpha subunit